MPMEQRRVEPTSSLDGLLNFERDAAGVGRLLLAADELADHLVDGWCVGHGATTLYRGGDLVRELGVDRVRAVDQDDAGDELLRFADLGECP